MRRCRRVRPAARPTTDDQVEAVIANPRVRSPGLTGALVAFSAFVGIFATTPGQTVGVSSFIDPIAADLGLAREHVLLLYSIGTFLGILTAPAIGRLVDRFGPRRLIAPIVVALAIACGVMSVAWNAWSLAAGFVLCGPLPSPASAWSATRWSTCGSTASAAASSP